MGKPRIYGMRNTCIPNSKADARYKKNIYQRGRDFAERHPDEVISRRERAALRELERLKGVKA